MREKEERKQAKEDRKKRAEQKRKDVAKRRKSSSASRRPLPMDSDEDAAQDTQMRLDDSSEYSDELEEDAYLTQSQYPFAAKEPEVG